MCVCARACVCVFTPAAGTDALLRSLGNYAEANTPTGRGFQTFLGYYGGAEDYLLHQICTSAAGCFKDFRNGTAPALFDGTYSTGLFADASRSIIARHKASRSAAPLFIYQPFQACHSSCRPSGGNAPFVRPPGGTYPKEEMVYPYSGTCLCTPPKGLNDSYDESQVTFSSQFCVVCFDSELYLRTRRCLHCSGVVGLQRG